MRRYSKAWLSRLRLSTQETHAHTPNGAGTTRQPGQGTGQPGHAAGQPGWGPGLAGWGISQAGQGPCQDGQPLGFFPEPENGLLPQSPPKEDPFQGAPIPKPRNGAHFAPHFPQALQGNGASKPPNPAPRVIASPRPRPQPALSTFCRSVLSLAFVFIAGLVSYAVVPSTAHPLAGWPLFFLGTAALLRCTRVALGAPVAVYWLPVYTAVSIALLGLPIYSALVFRLVAFFVLSFGGGVVLSLVVQSVCAPETGCAVNGDHGYRLRTE